MMCRLEPWTRCWPTAKKFLPMCAPSSAEAAQTGDWSCIHTCALNLRTYCQGDRLYLEAFASIGCKRRVVGYSFQLDSANYGRSWLESELGE